MLKSEALGIVAILRECYPRETVSQVREAMYVRLIEDLDIDSVLDAVTRLVARSKWFPTIAEIRSEVAVAIVDAEPAEIAWGEVRAVIRDRKPNVFDNPFITQTVRSMGWAEIQRAGASDRKQFLKTYEALVQRAIEDIQLPRDLHYPEQRRRLQHDEPRRPLQLVLTEGLGYGDDAQLPLLLCDVTPPEEDEL